MKDVVSIDELPLRAQAKGSRFAVEIGDIGGPLGLNGLGARLHVVQPGKTAYPFHRHHTVDELFIILSGTGEYRIGDDRLPVKAGDCLGARAGDKAHQIINTGTQMLRYIGIGNNVGVDVIDYPDTGRIAIDAGAPKYPDDEAVTLSASLKPVPMDYWDGEDIGDDK